MQLDSCAQANKENCKAENVLFSVSDGEREITTEIHQEIQRFADHVAKLEEIKSKGK